jgi:mono/diheme cytochrome c family protein
MRLGMAMKKYLLPSLFLLLAGCQQEMARQPSYRPLQPSSLFPDGMSARPLVPGTIARDHAPVSGKKPVEIVGWQRAASLIGKLAVDPLGAGAPASPLELYVDTFPEPVTEKVLKRGQDRFNIYCSVCHDRVGTGHGMIVQRGFTRPPNYHTDLSRGLRLRGFDVKLTEAPVGYYFEVISNGYGAMPEYGTQVPPDDRWAIIAYIRVLQFSQAATLDDVRDAQVRKQLEQTRGPAR